MFVSKRTNMGDFDVEKFCVLPEGDSPEFARSLSALGHGFRGVTGV